MRIFNGTPHAINIISNGVYDTSIRKYTTETPQILMRIPSNSLLSAKLTTVAVEPINGIPVFDKQITGCDTLPEGYDLYVVSALYASSMRKLGFDTSKLYTIADAVYSLDGKTILGCCGICPAF